MEHKQWVRRGFSYYSETRFEWPTIDKTLYYIDYSRKLGFIAYWLIKLYHGDKELQRLGNSTKLLD